CPSFYFACGACLATLRPSMLHVVLVLQHFCLLCCTWCLSCNILTFYVARGARLATFRPSMLHVILVLQHSSLLCCTWCSSCNILAFYVARGARLATFRPDFNHDFNPLLQFIWYFPIVVFIFFIEYFFKSF